MEFKKAQSKVSGLIILILALIIIYTLMMPPCDKCILLDTGCPSYCVEDSENILLLENPGYISYSDIFTRELGSVNLFIHYEPEYSELSDSLVVSKSWFGGINQELSFSINNFNDLVFTSISFLVLDAEGSLSIYLNDNQIFEGYIVSGEKTIKLPLAYLNEDNNLKFYVSTPGLLFWKENEYILKNVQIEREYELIHASNDIEFFVSENEINFLSSSVLEYSFHCTFLDDFSDMNLYLNNQFMFSEEVECISGERIVPINHDYFQPGSNTLKFLIDKGNFLIGNIKLINNLREKIFPSYSFDIINNIDKKVKMMFYFESSNGIRKADIFINDNFLNLNTYEDTIEFDITGLVNEGLNNLEIQPDSTFTVDILKIWYE